MIFPASAACELHDDDTSVDVYCNINFEQCTNPYPSHINEFGAIFGEYFIQYSDLAKNLTNFSHPDQATALLALVDEGILFLFVLGHTLLLF